MHLEAREAELSILGGVLLDNSALDRVRTIIGRDTFHAPRHGEIFEAMVTLADRGDPVDPITLVQHFEQAQRIEAVGGLDYLLGLAEASATAVNIEHHAGIVRGAADVRAVAARGMALAHRAHAGDFDTPAEFVEEAQAQMSEIGAGRSSKRMVRLRVPLRSNVETVSSAYETKAVVTGTPTGFADFDDKVSGMQAGDLVILAARPAMGKTAWALNAAANAAVETGGTVPVFSLEMPTEQCSMRMLSSDARVNAENMRTGHLTDGDVDRLLQSAKRLDPLHVYIDDTPGATVMHVRSECRRLVADPAVPPLSMVVIDYLQLMRGPAHIKSREQLISDITRSLKELAKELGCPVIALSQLNREVEKRPNKRPQLSDLRESGAIEQDADMILFVYRDEYYNPDSEDAGLAELIIGKNRSGSIGTVKLRFFKQWTRFDSLVRGAS